MDCSLMFKIDISYNDIQKVYPYWLFIYLVLTDFRSLESFIRWSLTTVQLNETDACKREKSLNIWTHVYWRSPGPFSGSVIHYEDSRTQCIVILTANFFFLWPHPWHIEVSGPGIESSNPVLSILCPLTHCTGPDLNLHLCSNLSLCSWILNPLCHGENATAMIQLQ